MGLLKKANRSEVKRYASEDGEDYIDFRANLTKGEANDLSLYNTQERDAEGNLIPNRQEGLRFVEKFFVMATVDWSLLDENTNGKIAPSLEAYRALTPEAGRWVDEQISAHVQFIFSPKTVELEEKPLTSPES